MSHRVRRSSLATNVSWATRAIRVWGFVLALTSARFADAEGASPAVRRFALVVSSNDGGSERVPLRFADTDARAVADVLAQLGGVRASDVVLLPRATPESLAAAFAALSERLIALGTTSTRRELFVYYSGHSDEHGLLLGNARVPYREMRQWIDATRADVRIAIFDSCASGAVIRERGGVHRPPFLSDVSVEARGHAFLTASSADEAAQESDRIRGGFFTHYFLSGLRGAADTSRDGRITLAEAYQFSYNETLRRTEQSGGRAQHPAYDIQLAGTGDLVLTDLRSTAASLLLEERVAGRVYVRDAEGRLMVELHKEPLYPVQLGLSPGTYRVSLDVDGSHFQARVRLEDGKTVRLSRTEFEVVNAELASSRGAPPAGEAAEPEDERPQSLLDGDLGVNFGGYAGLSFRYANLLDQDSLLAGAEVALLINHRLAVGFAGYGGEPSRTDGMSFGYGGGFLRYHFLFDSTPFYFSLGALAAAGGISDGASDESEVADTVFVFEPQLGGHLNLTRWMRMGIDVGYRLVTGAERFESRDVDGPMAGFHVQLGWF